MAQSFNRDFYAQEHKTIVEDASKKESSVKSFEQMEKDWRKYCSLWRSKPDLFLDFIQDPHSTFILFFYQRIILRIIFRYRLTFFTLTRGSSKSFIQILALMLKCIMFPGIKLTITAPQKQMAAAIAQQNCEAIWNFYPLLKKEVRSIRFEKDYTKLVFHNNSALDCVANAESSRGLRRNGLSIEEIIHDKFNEETLNSVLLPIMANNRLPVCGGEDPSELHKPICIVTTAGQKQSYAFEKLKEVLQDMAEGKSAFVLGSSFELPVMHNLLSGEYIQELREDSTFNLLSWEREYASVWSGTSENSLVTLEDFRKCRTLTQAEMKATDKECIYILSYDVARSEGSMNASSALTVFKCIPRGDGTYQKHVVNMFCMEGTHFLQQAIFLKQKVNDYNASCLVIDGNGLGAGIIDFLLTECDHNPPYSVINDSRYDKYKAQNSIPMIFVIKSQGKDTNASDIHNLFMNVVSNQELKFLESEAQARNRIRKKDAEQLNALLLPYINTDFLQEELMNLEYQQSGTQTKVRQISKGIGKDRYSSVSYGLFYIHLLEKKNKIRRDEQINVSDFFHGKAAKSGLQ